MEMHLRPSRLGWRSHSAATRAGRPRRDGRELDNWSRGRWLCIASASLAFEPSELAASIVWPGVRRAAAHGRARALTPGQRRRRRRLDSNTAKFGNAAR